jgi:hypothetical protein
VIVPKDSLLMTMLIREIQRQCWFALRAYDTIQDLVARLDELHSGSPPLEGSEYGQAEQAILEEFWYSVQGFLVAAANVSKLLWPIKKSSREFRADMRQALGISDNSLLNDRKFRDRFEHFDERLESWASSSERDMYVDQNIAESIDTLGPLLGELNLLRNFDLAAFAVTFYGEYYAIISIAEELEQVAERAGAIESFPQTKGVIRIKRSENSFFDYVIWLPGPPEMYPDIDGDLRLGD